MFPTMKAVSVLFIFTLIGLVLQLICGAYVNDFGSYPDEPAHFMSGVLVHDFLMRFNILHPMEYARNYYLHYPKLGIGQWPPALYALLGGWFLFAGVSRASAMAFELVVMASIATIIFMVGKRRLSATAGFFAGLLFLLSPVVQETTSRMMSDGTGALFVLLASLAFARFMSSGATRDGLLFGVLSAIAILTRGSGWALCLVPPILILIGRRFDLLRKPGLLAAAVLVLITCVPWYANTVGATQGTWGGSADGQPYWLSASMEFTRTFWIGLGPFVLIPALLGLWCKIVQPFLRNKIDSVWGVLFAYPIATWVLLCAVPTGAESRFMVALFPAVILFAVAGLEQLASYLPTGMIALAQARMLTCLAVAGLFFAFTFHIPKNLFFSGFGEVARSIVRETGNGQNAVLVASDSNGEGAVIAAIAMAESRPSSFVLRGSKILAKENWMGSRVVERCNSVSDISDLLNQIPVNVVVLDQSVLGSRRPGYYGLLWQMIKEKNTVWREIAALTAVRSDIKYPASMHIFVRSAHKAEIAAAGRVNIQLIRSLNFTSSAQAYLEKP